MAETAIQLRRRGIDATPHVVVIGAGFTGLAAAYQLTSLGIDAEMLEYAIPHLQRMFPDFARSWILASHVWHARFAQPIVTRGYREMIPDSETPLDGFHIATMAQIYPEDRGTNYAVREGRAIARKVCEQMRRSQITSA